MNRRHAATLSSKAHTSKALAPALAFALALCAVACGGGERDTPADTVRAACDAAARKDAAAYKKTFSKQKLSEMEEAARAGRTTLDAFVEELLANVSCPASQQFGAAEISGDTATLTVAEHGSRERALYRFVREEGGWKFSN